jgi:hypothetical protein
MDEVRCTTTNVIDEVRRIATNVIDEVRRTTTTVIDEVRRTATNVMTYCCDYKIVWCLVHFECHHRNANGL